MLVALTQIPTKLGTDFHIIVVISAMFVLYVFNNVAGVSNFSGRAAAFFYADFHIIVLIRAMSVLSVFFI